MAIPQENKGNEQRTSEIKPVADLDTLRFARLERGTGLSSAQIVAAEARHGCIVAESGEARVYDPKTHNPSRLIGLYGHESIESRYNRE
ncbi:MAG: hypothetical protein ACMXYE_01205 [Candidatus Woesearchaeota archaeon]